MNRKLHFLIGMCVLLLIAGNTQAQTTNIFDYGSSWKYLDNGSNQGTAWYGTSFSDASWSSATGFIGYGDTWINTCINACGAVSCNPTCTNKYITTYFRKTINIADTAMFDSVRLNLIRDDGMVVYINGVEVWRDNMPTGTVTYTTTAPVAIGNADETTAVVKTIPMSAFVPGNNVIAVELHQQLGSSSDLTFNMQAVGYIRTNLFNYGSAWKYLTSSTDQGTTWRPTSYSDASWLTGTGHIGFGETWTTTCIPAGPSGCTAGCTPGSCTKYTTTYFRKNINIADLSFYDSIRFSMFRDDGIVMYVNGTEVWRDNMPTGTVAYGTFAPNNVNGTTGTYAESTAVVKSIPISAFSTGTNTIAVELHQNSATSSDLDFNVKATGILHAAATPVTLSQGPYLQMGNKTAVSVRWRTGIASKSRVQVGTVAGTYPTTVSDAAVVTEHEVRVTGLTPNTKYYYRFGTDTSILQGDTSNFFVTAPQDTSTRTITIAAFGDCGRNDNSFQTGSLTAYQTYLASRGMKASDLMLLVGDNAYDAGTDAEFSANFFSRYSGNILKNHMLFPAPGNHDYANDGTRQADHAVPYYSLFSMPTAGECGGVASGTEAYYSYDWGNVHILSLDSYGEENGGTTRLYDTLGAQVTWIKNDLAANNKKWTIAYWHHPPYTMGSHTSDGEAELVNIRQNFIRILERYGVDMIICGHSHDYERSYLLKGHYGTEASFNKAAHTADSSSGKYNGTTNSCPYTIPSGKVNHGTVYVVSGSSGADGGVQSGYPHNALPFAIDDGGMFFMEINNNRLDAKFLRRDNSIADQFTMMKDVKTVDTTTILPGQSTTLSASWIGAYAWNTGATTRTVTVTPAVDTLITVKDSLTNTCIIDKHYIDVTCTMPAFAICATSIHQNGCNPAATYSVSTTGLPAPTYTYTFAGATTGSGNGTGSGATFNAGITTVTITATNTCGSVNCIFNVTIDPLPAVYNVTGTGSYCSGGNGLTVGIDNSQTGVNYSLYDGATLISSAQAGTGSAISFGTFTTATTYSVLATEVSSGCTQAMSGNAAIAINPLPTVYTVTGGGSYCAGGSGVGVGLDNSQSGISYQLYNGATAIGSAVSGTGSALSIGSPTAEAAYTVSATNTITGCTSNMAGNAGVTIDALPIVYNVTGGGDYCTGSGGVAVGLDNSETGIGYQLYTGAATVGSAMTGTGSSLSFGSILNSGSYTVQATNTATGCTSAMNGAATVTEHALPLTYAVTGTGSYCAGGAGRAVGIAGSETGINYQLYNGGTAVSGMVAGTGAAISFGNYTTAATYAVVAANPATSCINDMTGNATVSINPLPVVYSVSGGGAYCAGGTGVTVHMHNSEAGISYQLYRGTAAATGAVTGTGGAISFGSLTTAGTYTVLATNTTTGCIAAMTSSAIISVNPLPVAFGMTGGGNYCAGGSGLNVGLTGSETGISYQLHLGAATTGTALAGTGSTLSYGLQSSAGNYSVVATNTTTGCVNNMSGNSTINIDALPAVYAVSGGGSYCSGGTGVHIDLGGSTAGITYQVFNGAVATGTPVTGTGAPMTLGAFTAEGTYSVLAVSPATSCISAMLGMSAVTITPLVTPSVVISSTIGDTLCAGTTNLYTATATNGGTTPAYKWYVNGAAMGAASTLSYVPTNGNTVTATVISNADCRTIDSATSTRTMVVKPNVTPMASITANPGNILCTGSPVTFSVTATYGGTAPAYTWIKNGSVASYSGSYSYVPTDGDNLLLSMTSNYPCRLSTTVFSNSVSMSINERYLPSVTLAANPGTTIVEATPVTFTAAVTDGGPAPVYSWYKNGTLVASAATNTYTTSDLEDMDSVSCRVMGSGACGLLSYNSLIVHVSSLGVTNVSGNGSIAVIPNPNNGTFRITGSLKGAGNEELPVSVTNMLGQVVYKGASRSTNSTIDDTISLSNDLADGVYLLSIQSHTGNIVTHIVVSK